MSNCLWASNLIRADLGIRLGMQETPSPSPSPFQAPAVADFPEDFAYIFALVLLVALTWSVLLWIDLRRAYRERADNWYPIIHKIIDRAAINGLSTDELTRLTETLGKSPTGVTGLARTTMALTVATIISVTLVLLILTGSSDADQELVKSIVTALVAAFTTIIGFYFGARTAEGGTKAGADAAGSGPVTPAVAPTTQKDPTAGAGAKDPDSTSVSSSTSGGDI